jgi:hypothetical protein
LFLKQRGNGKSKKKEEIYRNKGRRMVEKEKNVTKKKEKRK